MMDFPYETRHQTNQILFYIDRMGVNQKDKKILFKKACEKNLLPICHYLIKSMKEREVGPAIETMVENNCQIAFFVKPNILTNEDISRLIKKSIQNENKNNVDLFEKIKSLKQKSQRLKLR